MAKDPAAVNDAGAEQDPFLALVGSRIRAARKRAKLKQSELAKAIGSRQSYIVSVEAGEQNLTLKILARLAVALGVAPTALLIEERPTGVADNSQLDQIGNLLRKALRDGDRLVESLRQAHALTSYEAADLGDTPQG